MENIIYGPQISEETKLNTELELGEYLLKVSKNHLEKVLMVSEMFLFQKLVGIEHSTVLKLPACSKIFISLCT